VSNVGCGKGDKVLICKRPPGNASKSNELCIAAEAVSAHLATGSYLGTCLSPVLTKNIQGKVKENDGQIFISIQPNPSSSSFLINSESKERGIINVYDPAGRLLEKLNLVPGQKISVGEKYQPGVYYFELIQGSKRSTSKAIKF
jgi:hypothetical protein